ncbi:MAG: hypothetical protein M3530_06980 [Thermoproteota archaeon]|nr:hypothetical protein [Thermoproteota archaeon]
MRLLIYDVPEGGKVGLPIRLSTTVRKLSSLRNAECNNRSMIRLDEMIINIVCAGGNYTCLE